ncbi:hypothetical protein [Streptomyces sp. NBC_01013]|nr:hypothetical protein OG538_04950 [Streptomyces sp. NBC_01013]
MQHRTVFELMIHGAVTAAPQTPFRHIARLFGESTEYTDESLALDVEPPR